MDSWGETREMLGTARISLSCGGSQASGEEPVPFWLGQRAVLCTLVPVPPPPPSAGVFAADPQKQRLLPQASRTLLEEPAYTLSSLNGALGPLVQSFSEISGFGENTSGP